MSVVLGALVAGLIVWTAHYSIVVSQRMNELPRRDHQARPRSNVFLKIGVQVLKRPPFDRVHELGNHPHIVGALAIALPPIAVIQPIVVFPAFVLGLGVPIVRRRLLEKSRLRQIEQDMPMFVDLVCLGVRSGLTARSALEYVSNNVRSPISEAFTKSLSHPVSGLRLAEVLEHCETLLGESALPLTSTLKSAERYGSPVGQILAQLAQETRLDQERRAEQSARRLSIQLLFPLAGCILPAFALLTVTPMLAGSIGSLATSFN